MELKPALSFDKQIDRLEEEHGLRIEDRAFALGVLSRVNYYRLSAYGIGLKKTDDPDKYIENISLEHLYNLYLFDSYLRSALLLIIEQIEIELRTQIHGHKNHSTCTQIPCAGWPDDLGNSNVWGVGIARCGESEGRKQFNTGSHLDNAFCIC